MIRGGNVSTAGGDGEWVTAVPAREQWPAGTEVYQTHDGALQIGVVTPFGGEMSQNVIAWAQSTFDRLQNKEAYGSPRALAERMTRRLGTFVAFDLKAPQKMASFAILDHKRDPSTALFVEEYGVDSDREGLAPEKHILAAGAIMMHLVDAGEPSSVTRDARPVYLQMYHDDSRDRNGLFFRSHLGFLEAGETVDGPLLEANAGRVALFLQNNFDIEPIGRASFA